MNIKYNENLHGWEIVWNECPLIAQKNWGKSVNGKVYQSWDEASTDLDKWSE